MNLENPELNEPFTARVLGILESSTLCANRILASDSVDDESIMAIIARLSIIESRLLIFLSCLHDEFMEKAIKKMNVDDEILFMDAAEEFIKEVSEILKELE